MELKMKKKFRKIIIFSFFFCFSLSNSNANEVESLYGILIEGMDLSGKTTVCKALKEMLENKGVKIKYNHCYLSDNFLVGFLFEKAMQAEGTEDESYYYASATVLDHFCFKKVENLFYIQDRNWLSQECWSKFFCSEKKFSLFPKDYIIKNHIKFKWNVYLALSYETFKNRYEIREEKTLLNKVFFNNRDTFSKYQEFCLSKLPKNENWLIIYTDFLNIDEIIDQILEYTVEL